MGGQLIAGLDFSGAKQVPNDTWIASGELGNLGLQVHEIRKIGAHMVSQELSKAETPFNAAGIDVPFSLPTEFLAFMSEKCGKGEYQSWQEVAEELVFMDFERFQELAIEFKKEPKRICDKAVSRTAQSPLHRGNPSMIQMTYQAIKLLAMLNPEKFAVLPFHEQNFFKCSVLEVYPRDVLFALGLPDTGYKSKEKKDQENAQLMRRKILDSLIELREKKGASHKDCPRLTMSAPARKAAIESDHALDALVACYAIAMWKEVPALFQDPLSLDNIEVLLEGWIYSPQPLVKTATV
jgi:hypothetical protein